jgi:hypothetical protein
LAGIVGVLLLGLWGLTDHAAAYRNENVLQFTPLALPLVWLIPRLLRSGRSANWTLTLAIAIAALSCLGLVLKLFPGFDQVNAQIIALAMPAQLGVAAGVRRLAHQRTIQM